MALLILVETLLLIKKGSVEHFVSLECETKLLSGSVSRSLVLDHAVIDIGSSRLVDSVIGSRSIVRSLRELYGNIRLVISDQSFVEL
jgi:glucose-1-phosphate thymidylyltransferase